MNRDSRLVVRGPGTGTMNGSGGWTGTPGAVVLDVMGNAQDHGPGVRRTAAGVVFDDSDVLFFPPRGTDVSAVKAEMAAELTWPDGTTQGCQVVRPRRLDQTVALKFV